LKLKNGTTNVATTVTDGTSAATPFTLTSTTAAVATLSVATGIVLIHYVSIDHNTATGGATFKAGPNAVNGGNNTGWEFLLSGVPVFELGDF
jgi:hypothetical protein